MGIISYSVRQVKASSISPRLLSYQELDILHALRGFCAFYVVVFHAKFLLWSGGTEYLRAFPRAGWHLWQYLAFAADMCSSAGFEMVIVFFVLSGFFIRYAQLRKHRTIWNFYLNRIMRIYPPYLASLLLSVAVLAYVAHFHSQLLSSALGRELNAGLLAAWNELNPFTLQELARTFIFLKPQEHYLGYNEVYWSLLPEALFYLLVPVAFWQVNMYYALSAACYAFGMIANVTNIELGPLGDYVFCFNGYFALGVGLYDVVASRPGWLERFRKINGYWLVIYCVALAICLIVAAALHLRIISGLVAALLGVFSISVLLAGRVNRQNVIVRLFHEVGIFSFSLYLCHFPFLILCYALLTLLTGNLFNYSRLYWVALPVITAACFAFYYVTERLAVRFFRGK